MDSSPSRILLFVLATENNPKNGIYYIFLRHTIIFPSLNTFIWNIFSIYLDLYNFTNFFSHVALPVIIHVLHRAAALFVAFTAYFQEIK